MDSNQSAIKTLIPSFLVTNINESCDTFTLVGALPPVCRILDRWYNHGGNILLMNFSSDVYLNIGLKIFLHGIALWFPSFPPRPKQVSRGRNAGEVLPSPFYHYAVVLPTEICTATFVSRMVLVLTHLLPWCFSITCPHSSREPPFAKPRAGPFLRPGTPPLASTRLTNTVRGWEAGQK